MRRRYQNELDAYEKNNSSGPAPLRPKGHLDACSNCNGLGIVQTSQPPVSDEKNYPQVAIIGGGIGGIALAVACLHRAIPFTIYERDSGFDVRSQGYGLTLQQASKAIEGLGVHKLKEGVVSTRHVVHTPDGKIVAEWGMRKWGRQGSQTSLKRTNVHIARQSLRAELIQKLAGQKRVQWGHQLLDFSLSEDGAKVDLRFLVEGVEKLAQADLVVGADGIRSTVRKQLIGEQAAPLRYLGCLVVLGICPLENLQGIENELLDSATVFQTANGNERIYMMPYSSDSVMWQLSFPMDEEEAKELSGRGASALKDEARRRCPWHDPIPQILAATEEALVSGYPVYDRALLKPDLLESELPVTLIGDAAHPMSPFKGQGANQALLDALSLARALTKNYGPFVPQQQGSLRDRVLREFEVEMLQRSAVKVKDSADAAEFLHSEIALHESNKPRGQCRNHEV